MVYYIINSEKISAILPFMNVKKKEKVMLSVSPSTKEEKKYHPFGGYFDISNNIQGQYCIDAAKFHKYN